MNIAKLVAFIKFTKHVMQLWWHGFADVKKCLSEKKDVTWSIRFAVFSGTGHFNRLNRYNIECDKVYNKYIDRDEETS